VGLEAGLDDTEDLTLKEFDSRTVRVAASYYTYRTLTAAVKQEPYISLNYSRCVTKMEDVIRVMERDFIWVADIY